MPIYQTEKDVANENRVISALKSSAGLDFLEIPGVTSAADWASHRDGQLKALIEVKNRTNSIEAYPTYMIDKEKIDTLYKVAETLQLKSMLAVGFTDCIGLIPAKLLMSKSTVGTGGRTDRNDPNDIDEVYYLPIQHFQRVDWT